MTTLSPFQQRFTSIYRQNTITERTVHEECGRLPSSITNRFMDLTDGFQRYMFTAEDLAQRFLLGVSPGLCPVVGGCGEKEVRYLLARKTSLIVTSQ